jgi:hypothetical protein
MQKFDFLTMVQTISKHNLINEHLTSHIKTNLYIHMNDLNDQMH